MHCPVMIEGGRIVLAWSRGCSRDETGICGDHEEAMDHSWCPMVLFVTALPQIPATRDCVDEKESNEPRSYRCMQPARRA